MRNDQNQGNVPKQSQRAQKDTQGKQAAQPVEKGTKGKDRKAKSSPSRDVDRNLH